MPYAPILWHILGAYFLQMWGWGWSELFSVRVAGKQTLQRDIHDLFAWASMARRGFRQSFAHKRLGVIFRHLPLLVFAENRWLLVCHAVLPDGEAGAKGPGRLRGARACDDEADVGAPCTCQGKSLEKSLQRLSAKKALNSERAAEAEKGRETVVQNGAFGESVSSRPLKVCS